MVDLSITHVKITIIIIYFLSLKKGNFAKRLNKKARF